jgi:sec-independent protein translocase protein TatC
MPHDFEEPATPNTDVSRFNGEPKHDGDTTPAPDGSLPQTVANPVYSSASDPYGLVTDPAATAPVSPLAAPPAVPARTEIALSDPPKAPPPPPPPPPEDDDEGDEEEKGMLRMSFMEHLEELRARLIRALGGIVVAFLLSLTFCKPLWDVVEQPAVTALKNLKLNPELVAITPTELFNVVYLKLPLLVSLFLGAPWVLYQVWAFISPGLYKRERRWAVPFILCTAGLFIAGGCFAYFVVFRFGLEFLLGIGRDIHVAPMVSINEYFDLFVNVTLGVGLVFEMPVIIFFLTLLRLASPRFLLRHSRYAVLGITILAAVVTPTPDVFNMMIFAVPMVMLFFVGVFASHLLILKREGRKFPWKIVWLVLLGVLLTLGGVVALFIYRYHYHLAYKWPYLFK